MTIKQYLKSKEFEKEFACWDYATKITDREGNDFGDKYDLGDDEVWEKFISSHKVIGVYKGWELGCDYESYAYAQIITEE